MAILRRYRVESSTKKDPSIRRAIEMRFGFCTDIRKTSKKPHHDYSRYIRLMWCSLPVFTHTHQNRSWTFRTWHEKKKYTRAFRPIHIFYMPLQNSLNFPSFSIYNFFSCYFCSSLDFPPATKHQQKQQNITSLYEMEMKMNNTYVQKLNETNEKKNNKRINLSVYIAYYNQKYAPPRCFIFYWKYKI